MKRIQITAPAKINLCLEVRERNPDGFHEIRSIMTKSSSLYDMILVEFIEGSESISIVCDNPSIPTNERNTCWKIAQKYFSKTGQRVGVKITITKRIPNLSGLGGGSSDAASTLLALNEYFGDPLSLEELMNIGAQVGKDIPFFLQDAFAAYVSGTGEKLESLFDFPALPILVVHPTGEEIGTAWAYGRLDQRQWFMQNPQRKNLSLEIKKNHHIMDDITPYIHNDFEFIAQEQCYFVDEIKTAMRALGARATSISGKGPTVFGVFESIEQVEKVQEIFQKQYPNFLVSRL
jgi:4-diphosphocytidyl-2-C-methyl-D-erythritol kinase